MLRVLFLFGRLALAITLLTAGAVFAARLPNRYACVTVVSYNTYFRTLYDPGRDFFSPETTFSMSNMTFSTPTDYYLSTIVSQDEINRFRLALRPMQEGEEIVVEEGVYQPTTTWLIGNEAWSTDRQSFAYLWQDAAHHQYLSIFNLADRSKQTMPIDITLRNVLSVFGWSGDDHYIVLGARDSQYTFNLVSLVDVEQMDLLFAPSDFPRISRMAWSPSGHQLAAVARGENNRQQFLLIDPERLESPTPIEVDTTSAIQGISWSSDSRYMTLARLARASSERSGRLQWYFDIYSPDGDPVVLGLVGKKIDVLGSANNIISTMSLAPGFWSLDGARWNFLEERIDRNHPRMRLIAFDPMMGTSETIEADIVSDLYVQMFDMPPSFIGSIDDVALPINHSLLLPQYREDGIALDYIDYRNNTSLSLLRGADEVLNQVFTFSQPQQFLWNSDFFVIPWMDNVGGKREAHLTILHSDDGEMLINVAGMETISQLTWMELDWLGFIASRDGVLGVELVNFTSGSHYRIPVEIEVGNGFYGEVSPDRKQIALVITPNLGFSNVNTGSLILASLEDGTTRFIDEAALPYGQWAPDSSAFIFQREGDGLQVINPSGDRLSDADFRDRLPGSNFSFEGWNRCEGSPPA